MRAIVAVSDEWGIGKDGKLLIQNSADMQHFVKLTSGCCVVMGINTLKSFPKAAPLKNRRNIVLTHSSTFSQDAVEVAHNQDELLKLIKNEDPQKVWLIGGAGIYKQFLALCSEAIVTKNHCLKTADCFFPNLDEDPQWKLIKTCEGGYTKEGIHFEFAHYVKA